MWFVLGVVGRHPSILYWPASTSNRPESTQQTSLEHKPEANSVSSHITWFASLLCCFRVDFKMFFIRLLLRLSVLRLPTFRAEQKIIYIYNGTFSKFLWNVVRKPCVYLNQPFIKLGKCAKTQSTIQIDSAYNVDSNAFNIKHFEQTLLALSAGTTSICQKHNVSNHSKRVSLCSCLFFVHFTFLSCFI